MKNEKSDEIKSLAEQGDFMDATILSTQLIEQKTSLPPPISPVISPTSHLDESKECVNDTPKHSLEKRFDLSKVFRNF